MDYIIATLEGKLLQIKHSIANDEDSIKLKNEEISNLNLGIIRLNVIKTELEQAIEKLK